MASAVVPISILGTRFAIGYDPFWQPAAYIPVLGMLCGNAISAIVVSTTSVLRDIKWVLFLNATKLEQLNLTVLETIETRWKYIWLSEGKLGCSSLT